MAGVFEGDRKTKYTEDGRRFGSPLWLLPAIAVLLAVLPRGLDAQMWQDPVLHNITDDLQHGARAIPVDMDADGDLDLIATYSLADAVYLLINTNGDARTWQRIVVGTNIAATFGLPFDADCDGDLDIAALNFFDRAQGWESQGEMVWYERPANLSSPWTKHVIDDTLIHLLYLDAGDVDGDGDGDLVLITNSSSEDNVVVWYENRCGEPSSPRWQRWTVASGAQYGSAGSVRLADLDGDTDLDVVVADRGNDRVVWFENAGGARRNDWTRRDIFIDLNAPSSARPYDMDGDTDLDVLVAFDGEPGLTWYENPADPVNDPWTSHTAAAFWSPKEIVRADFNNDGRPDIAAGSGQSDTVAVFGNNGDGTYTRVLEGGALSDGNYYSFTGIEAADLDGDGDIDIITTSYDGHSIDWWETITSSQDTRAPKWLLYE